MSELVTKSLLSALGLANLTRQAIQKTVQDAAAKSSLSEKEGRRLVKDLQRRSTHAQKRMQKTVRSAVSTLVKDLNTVLGPYGTKTAKARGKARKSTRRRGSAGAARGKARKS
jgi:polyhydroxyalkanoate synthesis regulator phasin